MCVQMCISFWTNVFCFLDVQFLSLFLYRFLKLCPALGCCSVCVRCVSRASSPFFFFSFFYESVYIIYILLFKIFWHSDFHFTVASGSCACWSVFMGPGEFRDRIWRQRPNASCCSSRGSSSQSHWEKARRCVCLSLTFNSIFVEIDVEIYQKSDGYRGVSSRIFDLIERRIIIIISYQSHTLAAFFCKLLISPCTVCKYV